MRVQYAKIYRKADSALLCICEVVAAQRQRAIDTIHLAILTEYRLGAADITMEFMNREQVRQAAMIASLKGEPRPRIITL